MVTEPPPRNLLELPVHAPVSHDGAAGDLAKAAGARAVTIGSAIYMAPEAYRPDTRAGRELIAHEQVHVAQAQVGHASGEAAEAAAETEARTLAPAIASRGWSGISVTRPAVSLMRDKIPDQDLSQDRDQIRATLEQRYPWLLMLSNRIDIEHEFVERIVLSRQNIATQRALAKLPSPQDTYVSDEIERRQRRRAPLERQQVRQATELAKHHAWMKIDIFELISSEMKQEATYSSGVAAMLHELKNWPGAVALDPNGLDSFRFGLTVYYGGQWIPVQADGIHTKGFFADAWASDPNLAIQHAFSAASAQQLDDLAHQWVDASPELAQQLLEQYIEQKDAAENPPDRPLTAEEREIADYQAANKQYAEAVRQKTEQAMRPLIFVASLFEIDGPVDLLLAVMPVDKIGAKLFSLGKDAIKARKARKLEQLLAKEFEHLDDEAKGFIKLARSMSKGEVRALKAINGAVKDHTLIEALMRRSIAGTADLEWIAKKLEKKRIDANFIRGFTKAESGPSWKLFEDIVEGRKVSQGTRDSLASKLTGFLGEQAAEKMAKTEGFVARMFGEGSKLQTLAREVPYGTGSSIDLVALSESSKLVVGEVKNFSTATWISDTSKVLEQLDRHNSGISEIAKAMSRRASDVKDRLLFVGSKGFRGLDEVTRRDLIARVKAKGWSIVEIPDSKIGTFGDLLDHMK